ncbi:MAG: ATP-binding protein [Clostridium sp.]|nr:ATP-binding protein [Clostridium sp.]
MVNTEILRIIEGGLTNDKRKVVSYSNRLADRLDQEGERTIAKAIRRSLENASNGAVADVVRSVPLDTDSRLQMVEIFPPLPLSHTLVLDPFVKAQIDEFVKIVVNSQQLELNGLDVVKTLLLYGKPGCGKTTLAHYISIQTGLPLIVAKLDSLVSSLLGSTAKNIRKVFEYASDFPCILFLDEFDAIAKARDDQREIGELKRVINSLLQNIDFMPRHCILIAATNHHELLDRAVWRRFMQKIEVSLPSREALEELIDNLSKPYSLDNGKNLIKPDTLLNLFSGLSPSDLKCLFERAKVKCVLEGQNQLDMFHLLLSTYELSDEDKSERDFVRFLNRNGVAQRNINKLTGISLRKIKNYLKISEDE